LTRTVTMTTMMPSMPAIMAAGYDEVIRRNH
jgi:hypothetical protein